MIHLVVGPPCAGKTTYAMQQRQPHDIVIDYDAIRAALATADNTTEAAHFLALRATDAAIDEARRYAMGDVYIIAATPQRRAVLRAVLPQATEVLLDPGRAVVEERAGARTDRQGALTGIARWYGEGRC